MSRSQRNARRALRRSLFGLARRVAPVLVVPTGVQRPLRRLYGWLYDLPPGPPDPPPIAVVFDAKAVCRVLADYETFPVDLYGAKMKAIFGPFMLGLDFPERDYGRQIALLRAVVEPADVERIRDAARAAAGAAIAAQPPGAINVVAMLQAVMSRFVDSYFGIPEIAGPDAQTLLQLNQRTASYIFNLEVIRSHLRADAEQAGARIRQHLVELFESKLASPDPDATTVLDRMVARCGAVGPPWSAAELATVAGGTISGLLVPTTAQFLAVVDRLLDLEPTEFGRLCAVARLRAGGAAVEDGRLAGYVLEAARQDPFPAGLQRRCSNDATEQQRILETGDGRRKTIPAGATVLALMSAAACDPRFAERPGSFAIARPASESLLFGTGQHHCIGATRAWPVATTLMTEMATALFSLPDVQRAPGKLGLIHKACAAQWPDRLCLTYTPRSA